MPTPIITDGSTDHVRKSPRVVLPIRGNVFAERAARFATIAGGNAMADYLSLMASVARAQQSALDARAGEIVPEAALAASRDYGMPPLSAQSFARSHEWRADLSDVLDRVRAHVTDHVASVLDQLAAVDDRTLEELADRVLAGTSPDSEAAMAPFIGAALQTYFTRLAAALDVALVEHCDVASICPACASRPVASVLRVGGDQANLRYLVCSLCATEWNVSRIQCTSCESEKSVKYLALQAAGDTRIETAARAETCDECKSYLKIFCQEKDPNLEPMADDLATLALDLRVDEQGYTRSGPNLLFHPGSS